MQIKNENDIQDPKFRKAVIDRITSNENQKRKFEAYRRYLCFKDRTGDFVIDKLQKQFDPSTVDEMAYAISNVSFTRKIVDKLARVYSAGVKRTIGDKQDDDEATKNIEKLEKALEFNTQIKATNKFLKLQRNIALYIKPCPIMVDGEQKYTIKLEPLNPYLYDVLEDPYDKTRPMVFILSDYQHAQIEAAPDNVASITRPTVSFADRLAPSQSAVPEPSAEQKDDRQFIWWSDNFHFTTDAKGVIIPPAEKKDSDGQNPIKELPFVNFAIDQDGKFWAMGGDDLVDGSILVNCILTHNQHVAVSQGYGQFWMSGKNLPKHIKVGPTKAILLEHEKDDPTPSLGFATASPQIDALRTLCESYIALLLTTNNLSTSAVGAQLGGSQSAASGIAMIIDKAESMEDVHDQRQVFIDKEPHIWRKIAKWKDIYKEALVDELKEVPFSVDDSKKLALNFLDAPMIMSEKEKLENLKIRKDLGLDSRIDLIMKDNPGFTKEQAESKLKQILEGEIFEQIERQKLAKEKDVQPIEGQDDPSADGSKKNPDDKPHDDKVDPKDEDGQDDSDEDADLSDD